MTLETLSLQNFKRYASHEMDFESGLCGILGRNGSGKSTLFEAVFFALYGEYRGAKELVRTAGSEGNVKVVLEFTVDEKEYTVTREFRGKALTAYASLKEADESLATGAKEVTAAVTKLLGMGREAFLHTVFASQKELTALSSMKNDERKAMMRRLLGLEKIDRIEEMIREALRDLNRDLKAATAYLLSDEVVKQQRDELKAKREAEGALEEQLKGLTEEGQKLKTAYEAARAAVDAQQMAREARQKKLEQLERFKQALAGDENRYGELETELKQLQAQQLRYNEQLPLKAQLEELEKRLAEQNSIKEKFLKKEGLEREQEQLRKEYTARKEEAAQLRKEIAPLDALQKRLTGERAALATLKTAVQQLDEQANGLNAEIATNRSKIADVEKKVRTITELGSDSACPVCTRPLLEQYDTVLASLQREIGEVYQKAVDDAQRKLESLNGERAKRQKELDDAEAACTATDKQIALLRSKAEDLQKAEARFAEVQTRGLSNKAALDKLGSVSYDENAHHGVKAERDALKPQVDALLKLEALIATIPAKSEALQKLGEQIEAERKSVAEQQKRVEEDSYSEKVHAETVENAKKSEAAKDTHAEILKKVLLEQANVRRDIEAIEKELKRDETQRAALRAKEKDRDDYEKLKAVMAEFKTHINARVAPRIGEVASEMYSRITRGRYQHIEVSPEFDFFIYDNGERYPIERFSGGEIDLANLVLRISISKTLGELSGGGNIGFLAFDEVFGSQDEERRFQIMEAFHTISESYRQIFLISHETEIKEMFERVVEL